MRESINNDLDEMTDKYYFKNCCDMALILVTDLLKGNNLTLCY